LIGEKPYNRRKREKETAKKLEQDDEALKQIALDTGLKPF
jgi:hypothetical protein